MTCPHLVTQPRAPSGKAGGKTPARAPVVREAPGPRTKDKAGPFSAGITVPAAAHAGHGAVPALRHCGSEHRDPEALPNTQPVCLSHLSPRKAVQELLFPHTRSQLGAGRRGEPREGAGMEEHGAERPAARCPSSTLPLQHFPQPPAKRTLRAASWAVWRALPKQSSPAEHSLHTRGDHGAETLPTAWHGLGRARGGSGAHLDFGRSTQPLQHRGMMLRLSAKESNCRITEPLGWKGP